MFENELVTLAEKLPRGTIPKLEAPAYDLMSDAFVWSDELIDFRTLSQGEAGAMRALWRYRTALITGVQDNRFRELWTRFIDAVPDWVGLAVNRSAYSETLAQRYKEIKKRPAKSGQM